MAPAPWNRPGESPATRRLRIIIFFTAVVGGVLGLVAAAVFVIFTLGNIS
ncbi:MAG: hypothetical protein HGA51_02435 [Demequinaceae bacterium]|nr:hypothetical protein [Demequinaceae bacterium]